MYDNGLSVAFPFEPDEVAAFVARCPLARGIILPALEQRLFIRFWLHNQPVAVIAEELGVSMGEIRTLLWKQFSDSRGIRESLQPPHAAD